ncbi:hypothetical protein LUZ60_001938 [Juncus effusus]|nr:hypothetical protein LUZ60_001938 [Juncus effusus]
MATQSPFTSSSSGSRKRSRPSAKSPAPPPPKSLRPRSSPFADFGRYYHYEVAYDYMSEKNRKLRDQFETDASCSSVGAENEGTSNNCELSGENGGIFNGVSIFVDGFTIPSSQELKMYMMKHGGRFVNYFSRHTVSHIICSNLPDSKIKNFRAFSHGLPVVKPEWIVDSLGANTLLSWIPYQLIEHQIQTSETTKQLKLSAFFSEKRVSNPSSSNQNYTLNYNNNNNNDNNINNNIDIEESVCEGGNYTEELPLSEEKLEDSKHLNTIDDVLKDAESEGEIIGETSLNKSKRPHSTLTDPNFVENYFKNSRLHFIGTWRNRYRKRFSNLGHGSKISNSNCSSENLKRIVIHIDMDCFFVSVVIRKFPELLDKPVAVCHSDNPKGTAEISSANYPARRFGIKAGMFVRNAKALCSDLMIFPYDFTAYEEVADQFYGILHKHCDKVQAVSCDEAYLEMHIDSKDDPQNLANKIRNEIYETTKCTASAGIGENLLMARLATKSAKPNGQCFIPSHKVNEHLDKLAITALPGVGYNASEKLRTKGFQTCLALREISKEALQKDLGAKMGDMLWNYCRGIDHSVVEAVQETKSIGAEVNWGVRFMNNRDSENFLMNLCKEVSLRLQGCAVQGRTITLKVKVRKKGADEPIKYMGCGDCDTISRSVTIPGATNCETSLFRIAKQIFTSLNLDVKEVRGMGLKLTRLEPVNPKGLEENKLDLWLNSSAVKKGKIPIQESCSDQQTNRENKPGPILNNKDRNCPSTSSAISQGSEITEMPPLSEIDVEFVKNLPPEIISEMDQMYKGALRKFLQAREKETNSASEIQILRLKSEHEESKSNFSESDLMPNSLSQLDTSALDHLPDDVRTDILNSLPTHRTGNQNPGSSSGNLIPNYSGSKSKWTEMFGNVGNEGLLLSDCLLKMDCVGFDLSGEEWDVEVLGFCEGFEEYVKMKVDCDIEELYNCFCLIKRFSVNSKFFLELHDKMLPHLQASINEHYGGKLLF